jgi:hypothetical protein
MSCIWTRCLKNAFDVFDELGTADLIPYFSIIHTFLSGLFKNHHSCGKLSKHPVDDVGMRHSHPIKDDEKTQGKNVKKGVEAANGVGHLFDKGGRRLGVKIKAGIECRGEDCEYSKIQDVKKSLHRGNVWNVGPCDFAKLGLNCIIE